MKKKKRYYKGNKPYIWHYETDNLQALCKEESILFCSGIPAPNTTTNPRFVTCKKCRKAMVKTGIIPPEDINNYEKDKK